MSFFERHKLIKVLSLNATSVVIQFVLGIFSKKITPKAGEAGLIGGFFIGMARLLTNILTNTGKDLMTGTFWENTQWFWQTNWLIFEIWLLVFIMLMMVDVNMRSWEVPTSLIVV